MAWVKNFEMIEAARDIEYIRCPIPPSAVNPKQMKAWIFSDHSQVVILGVYACYLLEDGSWSVSHLLGKSLLPPEGWTTPMGELHGISAAANLKVMLEAS